MRDGPARGGTRGGKDQFSWESVKGDKDREYYLGHSVKASVGRWQKGKDLLWYTRGSGDGPGGPADEIAAVKAAEERAMAEALGLAPPPSAPSARPRLTQRELDDLLRRGRADAEADEATRVRGLGSGADAAEAFRAPAREVMAGVGVPAPGVGEKRARDGDGGGDLAGSSARDDREARRLVKKAARREKKAAKKEAKRAKKEAKKAAKKEAKKRERRRDASSDSTGSDSSSGDDG
jgi:hypothetical protein